MPKEQIRNRKIKNELLSEIKRRIADGEERQNIYIDLCGKYQGDSDVAKLIAAVPSKNDMDAMTNINRVLVIMIFVWSFLLLFIKSISLLPIVLAKPALFITFPLVILWPIIGIFIGQQVKKQNGLYYRITGLLSIAAIFNTISGLIEKQLKFHLIDWIFNSTILILLICISIISFYIAKKYFPHLGFTGLKTLNGQYILGNE